MITHSELMADLTRLKNDVPIRSVPDAIDNLVKHTAKGVAPEGHTKESYRQVIEGQYRERTQLSQSTKTEGNLDRN